MAKTSRLVVRQAKALVELVEQVKALREELAEVKALLQPTTVSIKTTRRQPAKKE